jgi:hypothetical protein
MTERRHTAQPITDRAPFALQGITRWLEDLTAWVVQATFRLKRHHNPWVRRGLGIALVVGGLLWFLPVLGIWMLPLGVVVLSDEMHLLRRTRRRVQVWAGSRWPICRLPLPTAA